MDFGNLTINSLKMRTKINAIIDILMGIAFIPTLFTSLLIFLYLPHGNGQGRGRDLAETITIWGWDRHQWGDLHNYVGLAFLLMMALHMILHYAWWKCLPKILARKDAKCEPTITK
jgi:hypothetical protein